LAIDVAFEARLDESEKVRHLQDAINRGSIRHLSQPVADIPIDEFFVQSFLHVKNVREQYSQDFHSFLKTLFGPPEIGTSAEQVLKLFLAGGHNRFEEIEHQLAFALQPRYVDAASVTDAPFRPAQDEIVGYSVPAEFLQRERREVVNLGPRPHGEQKFM